MKYYKLHLLALSVEALFFVNNTFAQNPLIMDQFTADPTARVFEGKIFVYPSHDILAGPGKGRAGWFCMEDYHVFSSENLTDWKDHGVIVSQNNVDWVDPTTYSMWAPDCVFKNGKYYFYFPATSKEKGRKIGIAVSDRPYGPFKPEAKPIEGVDGIDPCVFIDKDGKAYLYYSMNKIFVAELNDNMLELDSKPQAIENLPNTGLLEGPFVFERNGIYYLTYPHVQNKIERLEYSTGNSPTGPFEPKGVIMDESPTGCWTNHHSIVQYKGQWYLFYHHNDLSPNFDKNRSIRADYLSFNEDGTIKKVVPTLRGVGITNAKSKIQIDRYSAISKEGASIAFLNNENKHEGWKIALNDRNAWVRYNTVDFGNGDLKSVNVRSVSSTGGTIEIHLDKADGPPLAKVEIGKGTDWNVVISKLAYVSLGVHDLIVALNDKNNVEIDWISFE
jgi:arabinoxylan arabinofuranohydrolase